MVDDKSGAGDGGVYKRRSPCSPPRSASGILLADGTFRTTCWSPELLLARVSHLP